MRHSRRRAPCSASAVSHPLLRHPMLILIFSGALTPRAQPPTRTLAQLSAYWKELLPAGERSATEAIPHLQPYLGKELLDQGAKDRISAAGVWKAVLAGCSQGDVPLHLSLEQSQRDYLCSDDAQALRITRTYDVDSFLARVTTPAVHKGDFTLCLKPAFGSRWTQDARVTFRDCKVHTMKQLRLGWGALSRGFGLQLHVFFPHMPTQRARAANEFIAGHRSHIDLTQMPTESQQADWLDHVIFPALATSCPSHIRHHYPTSSADVFAKAKVKREKYVTGQDGDLDLHYTIPERCGEAFWAAVIANAQDPTLAQFHDPLFVVVAHDLKLHTMEDTPLRARRAFDQLIDRSFIYSEDTFPPDDQWVDFGMEDTPIDRSGEGVTLLRRRPCLHRWVERFACPQASGPTKSTSRFWNWAMTRDAGTADLELGTTNVLRKHGGLAYFKAYNVVKNLFATPLKDYMPFDNPHFESLAFSDHLREEWYRANAGRGPSISRAAILDCFRQTKQRIHAAFAGPCSSGGAQNFGVRQEYRINIQTFRDLPFDDVPASLEPARDHDSPVRMVPSPSPTTVEPPSILNRFARQLWKVSQPSAASTQQSRVSSTHSPFWILPTADVMTFAARELGRWVLAAETLFYSALSPVPEADQLLYSTAVGTFIRSLRLSLSGLYPPTAPTMWLTILNSPKHRAWRGPNAYTSSSLRGEEEEDEEEEEEDEEEARNKKKRGLGYRECLENSGMMWLPPKMFTWVPQPCYTMAALQSLGMPGNAMQQSLKRSSRLEQQMRILNALHRHFQHRLQEAITPLSDPGIALPSHQEIFRLGAELVVAAFVGDVFHLLVCRKFNVRGALDWQMHQLVGDLTLDEAAGFCGLTYNILTKVLRQAPRLSRALKPTDRQTNRNGSTKAFRGYNTGRWADKVFGLFAWHPGTKKTPGWVNYHFRRLQGRFYKIIRAEIDDGAVEEFRQVVKVTAARHLWIIPQYSISTMSMQWKLSPGHCTETEASMKDVSAVHRTNWYIPCFPFPHEIDSESESSDSDDEDDEDDMTPRRRNARKRLWEPALRVLSVSDRRDTEGDSPKDPSEFGLTVRLELAAEAYREVTRQLDSYQSG